MLLSLYAFTLYFIEKNGVDEYTYERISILFNQYIKLHYMNGRKSGNLESFINQTLNIGNSTN